MIDFRCWNCGHPMAEADAAAGGMRQCSQCHKPGRVPDAVALDPSPDPGLKPRSPEPLTLPGPGTADREARRRAKLFPHLGPTSTEVLLALLGASLLLAGALLPLKYVPVVASVWDRPPDYERPNSFQTDHFGLVLLALAVPALAAALWGRSPALVQALGWGMAVLILVYLVQTVQFVWRFNRDPPRVVEQWGERILDPSYASVPALPGVLPWLALLAGAAAFVGAGMVGQKRIDAAADAHREIMLQLTEEARP
jgi:hypothetical protein